VRHALLVLLVACGSEKTEQAPPTPKPIPAAAVTTVLVGCTNALNAPNDPRAPILVMGNGGATTGISPRPQARPPRVVIQTPSVAGDLDAGTVGTILRRHSAKFQYCFEKQLLVQPDLAGGTIEAGFAVQPTGFLASPRADGVHPEVSKCIVKALESVAFPAPIDKNQVQVTVRIDILHAASTDPVTHPLAPAARGVLEWTPFAAESTATDDIAKPLVDATTAVMRERLPGVEACFDDMRGAVRAVIGFDMWGRIKSLRAGGVGDAAVEACIESALGDFTVPAPTAPVEVACDFTRGGVSPLRVSPDAGYAVIELTRTHATYRMMVREVPSRDVPRASPLYLQSAALIVAEPDAPAHVLEYGLWWAPKGTTLVAVKASGGAPVFLGMGDSGAQRQVLTDKRVLQLRTDNGRLRACITGETLDATAPILDPKAVDRMLEAAVAACKRTACEPTIVVGTSGEFVVKDLVATTSAARRAGFHAISIGGPACDR
jgi:hypothetical protein